MGIKSKFALAALALLTLSTLNPQLSTALAQGTVFTYQGRLNDGGNPAHGSYDFRFKLFVDPLGNTQAGGAVLANAVALTNGLFVATVDFGAGIFNGSNYWLEVDVRTNGAGGYLNLNPLQALTPAPYAIFATTASNVSGTVSSAGLSGTYSGVVTFNNSGNGFAGNGSALTSLNASQLTTGMVPAAALANAWKISGNSGTTAGVNFLGTADNQPLELRVNGGRALRLEPGIGGEGAPNVLGGSSANYISNGVVGATIGGGGAVNYQGLSPSNSVTGDFGTVSGGDGNRAFGFEATISGGGDNSVSNDDATIGGGFFNKASGYSATIGGGFGNVASGDESTAGGGLGDTASGQYATVGGGFGNVASGQSATVPGGNGNIASGSNSFAAGQQALASHPGTFVWADSQNSTYYLSDRANQFKIRAGGGMILDVSGSSGLNPAAFLVNSVSTNGVGLYVAESSSDAAFVVNNSGAGDILKGFNGGGSPVLEVVHSGAVYATSFNATSDRNAKENFAAVSAAEILDKVAALPITEWNFKTDPAQQKHLGPMAQDFRATFGLGLDDKHIATVDEGGVALSAIQGLNEKVEVRSRNAENSIRKLEAENAELKQELAELERMLTKPSDK